MKQRDLELLSAYLDGQLSPSDSARLETRLKTDLQLVSVLNDLRATRSLLRKLPARRAPRNFTLTRKMVGQNPPLPRVYPFFRFASAIATLLFVFSFGLNSVGRLASQPPAFGMGGGGGGSDITSQESTELFSSEPAAATEAPAAEASAEEPSVALVPPTVLSTDTANDRMAETPTEKSSAEDAAGQALPESEVQSPPPLVSLTWQLGLLVAAILSALLMVLMRQIEKSRWR